MVLNIAIMLFAGKFYIRSRKEKCYSILTCVATSIHNSGFLCQSNAVPVYLLALAIGAVKGTVLREQSTQGPIKITLSHFQQIDLHSTIRPIGY